MRDKPHDKMQPGPARDKSDPEVRARQRVDDFTEIPGVPAFVRDALHECGIHTFEHLRVARLPDIPWQVRDAIARWKSG